MRKLKVMGMISAITMAMVMAVSMTGCGNDASSVSRATKTTTKSVSQDNDTVSKSADDKNEDTDSKEETQTAESNVESNANEEQANNNLSDEERERELKQLLIQIVPKKNPINTEKELKDFLLKEQLNLSIDVMDYLKIKLTSEGYKDVDDS